MWRMYALIHRSDAPDYQDQLVRNSRRLRIFAALTLARTLRINARTTSHWGTDRRGARTLACSVATPRDARSVCTLRASSELDAVRMSACATTARQSRSAAVGLSVQ